MKQDFLEKFHQFKLKDGVGDMAELYLQVAEATEKLVEESYESEEKEVEFPIDIYIIARYLGMKIEKYTLNDKDTKRFSRILGTITAQNGNAYVMIDSAVSYKTQRYAIANSVGRFLLSNNKTILKSNYAIPLIPQSLEEIAADVIALFLLLPMRIFKDEFMRYLNITDDHPLDADAWLMYLGNKSQISMFNLAIGYQQMKQVLCYQRQKEFIDNGFDVSKLNDDGYDIIYA